LSGYSKDIKDNLIKKMYKASDDQNYEAAGIYKNRIKALTEATARQNINVPNLNNVDFLVLKKISVPREVKWKPSKALIISILS
jgi:excinuclease ABC subunit C